MAGSMARREHRDLLEAELVLPVSPGREAQGSGMKHLGPAGPQGAPWTPVGGRTLCGWSELLPSRASEPGSQGAGRGNSRGVEASCRETEHFYPAQADANRITTLGRGQDPN